MLHISTVEIPVEDYISVYCDSDRFIEYCRRCPSYGKFWACPPFESEQEQLLRQWKNALLIACRIDLPDGVDQQTDFRKLLLPFRERLEHSLLQLELQTKGMAFGFSGGCYRCDECRRSRGEKCCHPDKVRPALEAYGFDIGKTMEELFHIDLEWATDNYVPRSLTLVGALFHDAPLNTLNFQTDN